MKLKLLIVFCLSIAGFIFFTLNNSTKVSAATCTWNGTADTAWSNATNWSGGCSGVGGIPGNTDDLIFPNSAGNKTNTNDLVLTINSLSFDGAYTISGNSIILTTGITTINTAITLSLNLQTTAATQTWDIDPAGIIVSGNVALNGDLSLIGSGLTQIVGDLSGAGDINIDTTSNVNLSGTNSFVGNININGTLSLSSISASGNAGNVITVGDGLAVASLQSNVSGSVTSGADVVVNANATWILNGFDETVNSITGTGDIIVGTPGTLAIGGTATSFIYDGFFEGDGVIQKTGTGNVVLNGNSPLFIGQMSIFDGTVFVNGDMSGTNVIISGTLAGTGQVNGVAGMTGTISPGSGPGTLTASTIDWGALITYQAEINGTTQGTNYDFIHMLGAATLNDPVLSLSLGYSPTLGDTYTILHADGGLTGTFAGLPDGAFITIGPFLFQIHYTANDVILTATSGNTLFNPSFTATPNPAGVGSNVTIVSTWTGSGPVPTGTVEFFDGATSLGTVTMVNGVATLNISSLTLGTHSITAQYSGDGNYNPAISNPLSVAIVDPLSLTGTQVPVGFLAIGLFITLAGAMVVKKKF